MSPAPGEPFSGWECILLDPPCSGWGTAEKHPQVLRLWQGDKVKPLITLQRRLLTEAVRLLRPGGRLVYSTCTTNVEENEAQIRFAREELGLTLLPLEALPGFCFADPQMPECAGVWRVDAGGDGQGFFIALLQKNSSNAAAGDSCSGKCRQRGRNKNAKPGKASAELLERGLLAGPYLDIDLLPPGDIALFNAAVYFLPEHSRALPKQDFTWKGFPLGRFGRQLRSHPYLRALMPSIDHLRQKGIPYLDLDDPAPVLTLLTGRHVSVNVPYPELGLYFRGLPLCRLSVKGRRAMLPAL
jgi:16S rRNA (cytosine1407-C5)-methyltransferase